MSAASAASASSTSSAPRAFGRRACAAWLGVAVSLLACAALPGCRAGAPRAADGAPQVARALLLVELAGLT